jgi:DNA-binding MarR family transcriptional regulator
LEQDEEDWLPEVMPSLKITRIARALLKLNDTRLEPLGITASQLPVLAALKHGERSTQKELAQLTGVEQPSMAQLLHRMERDGLIRREPNAADKRSSLIALTDKAIHQLRPGRDALRGIDAEACAGLSDAERATLLSLLTRVAANIDAQVET